MARLRKSNMKGLAVIAFGAIFFLGIVVGRVWFMYPNSGLTSKSSPKQARPESVAFDVPQITLPADWTSKENLPGNSFVTASDLNPGIQVQGTFNDNNAIDYYSFTLKNPSQVIVNVTNVPKSLYWVIYDSQFKEIGTTYRTGTSQGSTQLSMQNPGKYYIKVWADYHTLANYPYTIRLSILPFFE